MESSARRGVSLLALLGCAVGLQACGRLQSMSRVDPVSVAVYPGGLHKDETRSASGGGCTQFVRGINSYSLGAVNLDCFVFPEDRPPPTPARAISPDDRPPSNQLAYTRAAGNRMYRNRLTSLLIKQSDDICVEEMGQLTSNEATVNASLNILSTAATTAANIVTGDQAASILTGVGTLAGASRSHIAADVYRNTFAYAISRAITLERERQREKILARFNDAHDVYSVDEAIRAVNQYHGVCSFYKGLELVLASVEGDLRNRETQARQAQIRELEEQVRSFREQMMALPTTDTNGRAAYQRRIDALLNRIRDLRLAGAPLPSGQAGVAGGNAGGTTTQTAPAPGAPQPEPEQPPAEEEEDEEG